jgi:hypothetical protein
MLNNIRFIWNTRDNNWVSNYTNLINYLEKYKEYPLYGDENYKILYS